jgi:hypothetical protein
LARNKTKDVCEVRRNDRVLSDKVLHVTICGDSQLDAALASLWEEICAVRETVEEILFICSPKLEKFMMEDMRAYLLQVSRFYDTIADVNQMVSMTKDRGMTFEQRHEETEKFTLSSGNIRDNFRGVARDELHLPSGT